MLSQWVTLSGVRVGEAANPGPDDSVNFVTAVINPTTILHKSHCLQQVCADVILASETAATAQVQRLMWPELRSVGYRPFWGPPVPERIHPLTGRIGLRGAAVGTAVFTRAPGRPAIDTFEPEVASSCRISECFVRCCGLELKIVTVYGWPQCAMDAAAKNNWLLGQAYSRVQTSRIPALVGGDMNSDPTSHDAWALFAQAGYVELHSFAREALALHLPPTCKSATSFDTMLIPPALLAYVAHAEVLSQSHIFDSHSPVRLHLRMPGIRPQKFHWQLPCPWRSLHLPPDKLAQQYAVAVSPVRPALCAPVDDMDSKLRVWSLATEEAVSATLGEVARDHQASAVDAPRRLPARYRGRCQPRVRTLQVQPTLPKQARDGDPQPHAEVTHVVARQRLKQARRLLTLHRGMVSFAQRRMQAPALARPRSLYLEWAAVERAAGYHGPFSQWALQWPCVQLWPQLFPSMDFVWELYQLVLFDYKALSRQLHACKRAMFRYKVQVDAKVGGAAMAFASVKPRSFPTLQQVRRVKTVSARQVGCLAFWCREYQVVAPERFALHSEVWFSGQPATVVAHTPATLTCQFCSDHDGVLPLGGQLVQDGLDSSVEAIDAALVHHWFPIWNRDSREEERDLENWPGYMALLRRCVSPCARVDVDMTDVAAWLHVIRHLSVHKSTGVCGWSNSDLRQLPDAAVTDLARILGHPAHKQFPRHLLQARVALLGKVENPTEASHTRPITVLSNLYRAWGRVLCAQVLMVWSATLPPSVQGCLKQRCSTDLCYWLQAETELALMQRKNCTGVAVDLRKAFNTLPRSPLRATLEFLGVPPTVSAMWTSSLASVERTFCVQASLGACVPSTTGAPEGDPVSVLGMTSLCVVFGELLQPYVQPRSFVDNWGWTASGRQRHVPAVRELTGLVEALRLQVDWGKSYCFATCPEARKWLRAHVSDVFPEPIPLLSQVKELGAHLQFSRHRMLGHLPERIKEANRRLHRLYRLWSLRPWLSSHPFGPPLSLVLTP